MSNLLTLQEHNELYRKTCEARPDSFYGYSLQTHLPDILNIVNNSNIKSILDFGCGQASLWKHHDLYRLFRLDKSECDLYDPSISEYSILKKKPYDMVLCIDVLEHIPEHLLKEVLHQIFSRTKKLAYLSISTRPASKQLIDGSNAHATVKPRKWWLDLLKGYDDKLYIVHFD
jgi:hypothetical protein